MAYTDEYLKTVNRLEPEIVPVDQDGALTSIAISLHRIATYLEGQIAFSKTPNIDAITAQGKEKV